MFTVCRANISHQTMNQQHFSTGLLELRIKTVPDEAEHLRIKQNLNVKVLYNNCESCIINDGHISEFFRPERGVHQSCPMSPYLFILGAETCFIRNHEDIVPVRITEDSIAIRLYADDTTIITYRPESTIATIFKDWTSTPLSLV